MLMGKPACIMFVCVCCRVHAELASGRVTYSTVELHFGIF